MRHRTRYTLASLLVLLALLVSACAPAAAPAAQAPATEAAATEAAAEATAESAAEATEAPADTAAEAPSGDVVEIEYWQYSFDARIEAMNQLIAQFEAENPNIKVIHNSDVPYDDFINKIAASVPAGVGPDVVSLFYGWQPAWIDAGYLVPLSEEAFPPDQVRAEFSPMVEASFFDGKLYTLPTAVRTLALMYNKDLMIR